LPSIRRELAAANPDQHRADLARALTNLGATLRDLGRPADALSAGLGAGERVPRAGRVGWHRYHSLFAEVLRLRLRREYPDRVPVLHRRAARWYGRAGLLTDAVRHAARAGDWPPAW
jgi:hypothetical protein